MVVIGKENTGTKPLKLDATALMIVISDNFPCVNRRTVPSHSMKYFIGRRLGRSRRYLLKTVLNQP